VVDHDPFIDRTGGDTTILPVSFSFIVPPPFVASCLCVRFDKGCHHDPSAYLFLTQSHQATKKWSRWFSL